MKILITGGAGFVGTNLIKTLKLKKPNAKLYVIDNYETGYKHNEQKDVEYNKAVEILNEKNEYYKLLGY